MTTVDGGTGWLNSPFTVGKYPAPSITSITPVSGNLDTTVLFTITGTYFQTASYTNVKIYNDVTNTVIPTNIVSVTPTTIIGSATIGWIPAGSYNVNVTTVDGGMAPKPGTFAVGYLAIPTITSLTPVSGLRNTTVKFTVTGTNFEPGTVKTVVVFTNQTTSATLTPIDFNATSTTQINGNVSIPYNAATGSYRFDVTTLDGGVVNKPNAFTVNVYPAPTITSLTPATTWYRNATIPFVITGKNFEPDLNLTTVTFNYALNGTALNITNGFTVNTITATTISGTVVVPFQAPTGSWNVSVTTFDGGTVWKAPAFTVSNFPAPTITSITPATGTKGSPVAFTLVGTNFELAGTSVNIIEDTSGTVLNTTLISVTPTKIVGNFTIPANVPASLYRLQVATADGGVVSKIQAFTINYLPLPVMTTLTPNSGYLNGPVPFTLTGNNFLDGGTTVTLRTVGTTITASTTSVNTTTVLGSFPIPLSAGTGPYTLYVVTTGGGFNSRATTSTGAPIFTVQTPTPMIGTISPPSPWYRDTTVAFTLTGSNFQSDSTTVTFQNQTLNKTAGAGPINEMDPMIFSVTPTQIVGSVSIPNNVDLTTWKVNVTTLNGGQGFLTGLQVTDLPAPTVTSFVPTTAAASSSVFFTMTGTNFQSNGGTIVKVNSTPSSTPLTVTLSTVSPTFVTGTISTPVATTPVTTYYVWVTTADNPGKWVKAPNTFTVV